MRILFALLLVATAVPALALEQGEAVPAALTARRLAKPHEPFSMGSLKGKVAYVDFWASWCVPCRISMPALDSLQKKLGARGFTVVGVNKDMSLAEAERFLSKTPVTFTLVNDDRHVVAKAFGVTAMPSGYLVDRRGVIRKVHQGFTAETAATLEREVEELLKEPS